MEGLFLGQTTIDIQFLLKDYPLPNKVIHSEDRLLDIGGPATNAAITFSHLGGESILISPLGKSFFSLWAKSQLEKYNVAHVDTNPDIQKELTISTVLTTVSNGDRTIVSKNYSNIDSDFNLNNYGIDNVKIILIDLTNLNLALDIAKYGKSQNIPVVLDADGWRPGLDKLLLNVDIPIFSENFFEANEETIREFALKFNLKQLVVTRGQNSIICYDNGVIEYINVNEVIVKDTLGAGDIFHGAFCYYYLSSENIKEALYHASKVASLSCSFYGPRKWMNQG